MLLQHIIIEGNINGKSDRGQPRTSYIKKYDAGLTKLQEIKEASFRDEWTSGGTMGNNKTHLRDDTRKNKYM